MRRPVKRRKATVVPIQPPIEGMYLNQSFLAPNAQTAEYMENVLPTQRGFKIRGGVVRAANAGAAVTSMFTYKSGTSSKLFAGTATDLYDISALDPVNVPTASLSAQNGGYYSTQQIGTGAGEFLVVVNGEDAGQTYDGTSFSPMSITGVSSSDLSHVWKHANRIFAVEKDTMSSWYLPVDSISGAMAEFSLAGTFQNGGALLFGATWSTDSGDGKDDYCVFVSTQGEIAIYAGIDPSDSANWGLVGRYDVSPPLSKYGVMRAGGDLLIATIDGVIPLSQITQKDPAALSFAAVSRPIEPLWAIEMQRDTSAVQLVKWSEERIGLVMFPSSSQCMAVNLQTGAWVPQTGGWARNCAAVFDGNAYAGGSDGRIMQINQSGADDDMAFVAKYCHSFNDLGDSSRYKRAQMVRYAFLTSIDFEFDAGVSFDYEVSFGAAPQPVYVGTNNPVWNDGSTWGDGSTWAQDIVQPKRSVTTDWVTVVGSGYAFAPTMQITSSAAAQLDIELVRTEVSVEVGEFGV